MISFYYYSYTGCRICSEQLCNLADRNNELPLPIVQIPIKCLARNTNKYISSQIVELVIK